MDVALQWQIIVPVRGGVASKTRLAGDALDPATRVRLARAFASDVVATILATPIVAGLTVVTRDPESAQYFASLGAHIFTETEGAGLNGAVLEASEHVRQQHPGHGIAALMGDLPGLTHEALTEALTTASALELGVLADHAGTGTTMLTATRGASLRPSYGAGSYLRHVEAGHQPIVVGLTSSAQRDVDTLEDLLDLTRIGLGSYTRRLLAEIELRA